LYISETEKGRIWRIIYTGETTTTKAKSSLLPGGAIAALLGGDTSGGKVYQQVCAACHMPNGSGVPNMQPALAGSSIVAGETNQLINVLLRGPAAVLPANRSKYSNIMPPFAVLSDADIASVINYLRKNSPPGLLRSLSLR